MFYEIDRLKKLGLKKAQIARKLDISRPTVIKYFDMSAEEFEKSLASLKQRNKKTTSFENEILQMLLKHPDLSGAQIYDRIHEKYEQVSFCEGTMRLAVRRVREKYAIPKVVATREYGNIDELPMGQQMQVDFGEIRVETVNGKSLKVYVIAFVLSHSRYKYCHWQSKPFKTSDVIRVHEDAFEFFGGIPQEIAYDQDHLILSSENHGDLIFTNEFGKYKRIRDFDVYMCRKADPESKGKIENVIKYIKRNFAYHRTFSNIDKWNEDAMKWLFRRGNGKMHDTTKKIPSEVFSEEKKFLKPVYEKIDIPIDDSSLYKVNKDNTVPIGGNKYTVPKGTYKGPETRVRVKRMENEFIISELETGQEIYRWPIFETKGNKAGNNNHKRDNSVKIDQLIDETIPLFTDMNICRKFLDEIRKVKPRYIRDQIDLIKKCIASKPKEIADKTLIYCEKNKMYSAVDFRDVFSHFERINPIVVEEEPIKNLITFENSFSQKINERPQIRDMKVYISILSNQLN